MNPLLDFSGLPRFADIRTEHITPAVAQLLADNRAIIARVRDDAAASLPGRISCNRWRMPTSGLSRAWGQVSHLNAVVNSPELREAYNANLPLVTQYYAELGQDQASIREIQAASRWCRNSRV